MKFVVQHQIVHVPVIYVLAFFKPELVYDWYKEYLIRLSS